MPEVHDQLAQIRPAINTDTLAYSVPGGTKALVYSVVVCNTSAGGGKFRVYAVPSAGAPGVGNAVYYDVNVPGNDTFTANISVTMKTGGMIYVRSDSGNHTFTISGMEIS